MPEIIILEDGTYRMFFTVASSDGSEIKYADSEDGLDWEVIGTALAGSDDPADPNFLISGASIVRLENGDWRMYYRATKDYDSSTSRPSYQNFSAISQDGVEFTNEPGVRVSIQEYDENSQFSIAGHGRYFRNEDGLFVGVFSANFIDDNGPSDLVLMTSQDGLNWDNFEVLYEDWHDPTIIRKDGKYIMYATYLKEKQGVAVSSDGLNWSRDMTSIELLSDVELLLTEEDGIADLGALVTHEGEIWMYTNYGHPGLNIALFLPNN